MKKQYPFEKYMFFEKLETVIVKALGKTLVDLGITEGSILYDAYKMKCRDYFIEELNKIKL